MLSAVVRSRDGNHVVLVVVLEAVDTLRRCLLVLVGQALVRLLDLGVVSAVALAAEDSVVVIAVTDLALVVVSATKEGAMGLAGPLQMRRLAQVVDGVLEVTMAEVAGTIAVERAAIVSL